MEPDESLVEEAPQVREADRLTLDLDGWEGPLDLLLTLARSQKVDLAKISILADNYDGTPIPRRGARPDLQRPALLWNPSISPGGMTFYSGRLFPQWRAPPLSPPPPATA